MIAEQYFSSVKELLFKTAATEFSHPVLEGAPKCVFVIDRELNYTTPFFLNKFIVDLFTLYGKELMPAKLNGGGVNLTVKPADDVDCKRINLTLVPSDTVDYRNLDFRYIIMADQGYHDLFRKYSVSDIYTFNFPPHPIEPNLDHDRYKVDALGKPSPL